MKNTRSRKVTCLRDPSSSNLETVSLKELVDEGFGRKKVELCTVGTRMQQYICTKAVVEELTKCNGSDSQLTKEISVHNHDVPMGVVGSLILGHTHNQIV
jgi:hypothetical protein